MGAWKAAQAELLKIVDGDAAGAGAGPALAAIRRMLEVGTDYAGLAADPWRSPPTGADLSGSYWQLFMPSAAPKLPAQLPAEAVSARMQRATAAMMRHAQAIAVDASRRLRDALAENETEATPITTLRALFELWVECGEAAWAAAARREDFAEAQAEWLAALVETSHDASPR